MAYLLIERAEDGANVVVGEPVFDLVVAKVIASRRAARSRRITIVSDQATGTELARFDGSNYVPTKSAQRMKAVETKEAPTSTLTRRRVS
jgi:hypothetical protein